MVLIDNSQVNYQYDDGNSLLMMACQKKDEETALFLIDKGADLDLINIKGESIYSILKRKRRLTPGLQAFKEKLILDNSIDCNQDESDISL